MTGRSTEVFIPVITSLPRDFVAHLQRLKLIVFDFDGVFTDNTVWTSEDGTESVRCSRSDGLGLERMRSVGVDAFILSTERNPVVSIRAKKLGIPVRQDVTDKTGALKALLEERGLSYDDIAYVGNDINDSGVLGLAGMSIVVADAHPEVLPLAAYVTRTRGGHGAVREVCDLIYMAKGQA